MNENIKSKKIISTSASQRASKKSVLNKNKADVEPIEMLFKKKNFYFVFAGLALMVLGFVLMSGGQMPSPDVWDDNLIYSFRRVFLAPLVILIGLGFNVYAIFIK